MDLSHIEFQFSRLVSGSINFLKKKPEFSVIRSLADALVWISSIISLSLRLMPGTLYCIIWAILRTEELR
jgi:hypothetical protein